MTPTEITLWSFSLLTFVSTIAFVLVVIDLLLARQRFAHRLSGPTQFLARHAVFFAFLVALVATAGSLTFSDILGLPPCKLCWFERIFMYPQVFMFLTALFYKQRSVFRYAVPLSIIGGLISAYHYTIQFVPSDSTFCSTVGYSVSCAEKFSTYFGYITIPMMCLTAFALILGLAYLNTRASSAPHAN